LSLYFQIVRAPIAFLKSFRLTCSPTQYISAASSDVPKLPGITRRRECSSLRLTSSRKSYLPLMYIVLQFILQSIISPSPKRPSVDSVTRDIHPIIFLRHVRQPLCSMGRYCAAGNACRSYYAVQPLNVRGYVEKERKSTANVLKRRAYWLDTDTGCVHATSISPSLNGFSFSRSDTILARTNK